jgi:hypothetical protein
VFISELMGKEKVVCIYNGKPSSYKKERNSIVYNNMNGTGEHYIKQNMPDTERQMP